MIIGTTGHIDHGKSALVRRLTGVDPDRLKEEKARGITIDLGFAYWRRPDDAVVAFVDVPGHEGLVHNMLSGATGIDFVLLVVAADDGVMPQTREHLAIMNLLGLRRGIVALNKADIVTPERVAAVELEIRQVLLGTGLAQAEILPVSALTGAGLDALVARLDAARAGTRARASDGAFCLAVDRVFTLTGLGTVVTGTVISGRVAVDDHVVVSPMGLAARVRSIHAQNQAVREGHAGQRCALALSGAGITKEAVRRGSMILEPRLHAPSARIDVRLELLASEPRAIGQWCPVRVHHGAAEVGGRIVVLGEKPIAPGAADFAQLVLEQPIAAAVGDRFIVRDTSARRTMGGGVMLDLRAPQRRRRTPERLAELRARAELEPSRVLARLLESQPGLVDLDAFLRDRALSTGTAAELIGSLSLVQLMHAERRQVMLETRWRELRRAIGAAVEEHHKAQPEQVGLSQEALRRHVAASMSASLFAVLIQRLVADGALALDRGAVRLPSHGIKLSPQDAALWLRIRAMLGGSERFRPPRVRDIAGTLDRDEGAVRRLMQLAAKRGELEEIAKDHYFLGATVAEIAGIAKALDKRSGGNGFVAAAMRDELDNGRKVAIQILEFFDQRGFTIRRGDLRRINPHRATMFDAAR